MSREAKISSITSLYPIPQYVVVLEDVEHTHLVPIWIGVSEGNSIALELQGEKFPRPLTHDLMINLFEQLGAKLQKITVTDLKDSSYFAVMVLELDGKVIEMDCRPSDALALAVRAKCPVFVDEKVLAKCPRIDQSITTEEIDKFKNDLKTMTPEEFFKSLEEAENESASESDDEDEEDDFEEDK